MAPRVLLTLLCLSGSVRAVSAQESAAELYDRGAAAYDAGDYDRALHALRDADALAANDVTLQLALRAALRSTQPVTALDTVERAERRGAGSLTLRQRIRQKFAQQVGRLQVMCDRCQPRIDGAPAMPRVARFVSVGTHSVTATVQGRVRTYSIHVRSGASAELRIDEAPVARRVTLMSRDGGVSPLWFWVGVAVTAGVATGATWSAFDTRERHQQFEQEPTASTAQAGKDSQRRTNLLALGTAVAAGATAALGLVVVEWGGGERARSGP